MLHILIQAFFLNLVVNTFASPVVQCTSSICKVHLKVAEGETHSIDLIPETHGLFSHGFKVQSRNEIFSQTQPQEGRTRYHSTKDAVHYATALIENNQIVDGIFMTPNHGAIEFRDFRKVTNKRRNLGEEEHEDMALELPEGRPWMDGVDVNAVDIGSSEYGVVSPFFPGCFPDDSITHTFTMNVAIDRALFEDSTVGITNPVAQRAKILSDLEHTFSYGKLLFWAQLNINLELANVIMPDDMLPLSRSKGMCTSAMGAFSEMRTWMNERMPNSGGHTMLLSSCFSGIVGVSYIGVLCGGSRSYGVAKNSWLTMFHELGHAFGMGHSFENGQGLTGGIMDYGDGTYQGVIQIHPNKRVEVCAFLSYLKSSNNCPFFNPLVNPSASCGDGILDTTREECECLDRSRSCGKCNNCKVAPDVECSAEGFLVRDASMPPQVVVGTRALANAGCCNANKRVASPKTLCGPSLLQTCGAHGQCIDVCTTYLEWNNPNCGFDESGCKLGCMWKNKCRFDLTVYTDLGEEEQISGLPDGSSCKLNAEQGMCFRATCHSKQDYYVLTEGGRPGDLLPPPEAAVITSPPSTLAPVTLAPRESTVVPSRLPTRATRSPVSPTMYPTKRPTKNPTVFPTKQPTTSFPSSSNDEIQPPRNLRTR